jgi:NADPH:quinone reductase-like Zn-dependent oxidoreductase
VAYATAWSSLYSHAIKLQAGQTVLCLGTGGVSLAAAQLALIAGAKAIITSSSQTKLDRARQILAPLARGRDDAIQTIDYSKTEKWDEEAKRLTAGRGVDFVIEIGGRGTLGRSLGSAKRGGFIAISGEVRMLAFRSS